MAKYSHIDHAMEYKRVFPDYYPEKQKRNWGEKWRGPHQWKELQMMLDGIKPVALVDRDPYHEHWKQHVDSGLFISILNPHCQKFIYANGDMIVALPSEKWRMMQVHKLYSNPNWSSLFHTKVGFLLGYFKDDISMFIKENTFA